MKREFSFTERLNSFTYAFRGVFSFLTEEHNARIHLVATIFVIVLSGIFPVSKFEIIALVFAIGFVWVAEIFNTAIEKSMDLITTEKDNRIKTIKDLSAGAVLVAAIVAVITACLIFIPKIVICIS